MGIDTLPRIDNRLSLRLEVFLKVQEMSPLPERYGYPNKQPSARAKAIIDDQIQKMQEDEGK